jgi:5-formyltetrahydrofolate cyclo-ligase
MTKQELRKIYLEKRKVLPENEYAQRNIQLYNHFFFAIDLSFVKVLHIFLPIMDKREPDTWPVIDRIRREYPHIRLAIPRVNNETSALENFYFEGMHQLALNPWGIQEPKQGIPTESEKIDMVLVPLLACDKRGNRLGYGKGYYDRFLRTCRPDVRKVGVSLFDLEEYIPAEAYDVKLTEVITPKGYIQFN